MVDLFTFSLLRRHIGHSSQSRPFSGQQSSPFDLGQTEVHDLGLAFLCDHDVGALDIPVNNAFLMGFLKTFSHLNGHIQSLIRSQRTLFYPILQALSFDVLHGDERPSFLFINLVDGTDIGMG